MLVCCSSSIGHCFPVQAPWGVGLFQCHIFFPNEVVDCVFLGAVLNNRVEPDRRSWEATSFCREQVGTEEDISSPERVSGSTRWFQNCIPGIHSLQSFGERTYGIEKDPFPKDPVQENNG